MGQSWGRILELVALLTMATAGGLVWRSRSGRVRPTRATPGPDTAGPGGPGLLELAPVWTSIGVAPADAAVTLVQFSSAFCAPCRATSRVLREVVALLPDVGHVEVDAESHLDAVRELKIHSTPTTLLVDRSGRVAGRAVGAPRRTDLLAAVGPFLIDR